MKRFLAPPARETAPSAPELSRDGKAAAGRDRAVSAGRRLATSLSMVSRLRGRRTRSPSPGRGSVVVAPKATPPGEEAPAIPQKSSKGLGFVI